MRVLIALALLLVGCGEDCRSCHCQDQDGSFPMEYDLLTIGDNIQTEDGQTEDQVNVDIFIPVPEYQDDELCSDGIDNDGNTQTDCEDQKCYGYGNCDYVINKIRLDNDGSGDRLTGMGADIDAVSILASGEEWFAGFVAGIFIDPGIEGERENYWTNPHTALGPPDTPRNRPEEGWPQTFVSLGASGYIVLGGFNVADGIMPNHSIHVYNIDPDLESHVDVSLCCDDDCYSFVYAGRPQRLENFGNLDGIMGIPHEVYQECQRRAHQ